MPTTARAKLLIVDDEPIIRESLGEFLTQEGFAVAVAGSAEDALALAQKSRFDLVLCDVQLPGIDGIELTFYQE